jgi:CRISPR-associated protein Cas1
MRDVPICWFTSGGWFAGMATGLASKHVELRRQQVLVADTDRALHLATTVIEGKIRNTRTLLMRNARPRPKAALAQLKELARKAGGATSIPSLLGVEGAAARIYFEHLPTMLRSPGTLPGDPFTFDGRNRRPPKDPVNALLSFSYALLTKDLTATLTTVGFDPYLGFLHRPRFGRPALALDLAEEFRPVIAESVVITAVNNGEVKASDFVTRAGGVALTPDGRRAVLGAYERRLSHEIRHPLFGYTITYRRTLEVQARLLGAYLLGEVPAYEPFKTR